MLIKNNNGITMIALVVTIIVLMILAGVSIMYGTDAVSKVKQEGIITNMIAIKSKAKVLAEEVNAKIWAGDDNDQERIKKLNSVYYDNEENR